VDHDATPTASIQGLSAAGVAGGDLRVAHLANATNPIAQLRPAAYVCRHIPTIHKPGAAMSDLLIELFSEEIPARMQVRAADDLRKLMLDGFKTQGLDVGLARVFSTPRRLTLVVEGVANGSSGKREEKKGPRVGAPDQAIQGFLKSAGFKSLSEATLVKDEKKGDFYSAVIEKAGRPAADIVTDVLVDTVTKFPWPKSMRWGTSELLWVRPLQSILCLLDGRVVPLRIGELLATNTTEGHRFLSPGRFAVDDFADYQHKLGLAHVILDPSVRVAMIREQAHAIAEANALDVVPDEGLLNENAGLNEWPTVLMGTFDEAFLSVPPECLTTAMRSHQKCFSLRDPKTGRLANRFLLVSNITAADGGNAIIHGNQKVIAARLSDAKFFWDQDLKRRLEPMHFELKGITFHEKLGSQWDRMERVTELARQIAGSVDAEPDLAGRAAQLCKADLVSGMVGEFPELQGLMGRYLAEAEHMDPRIARAIELHYKPKGPTDTVPREDEGDAVAIAVALADKLDTLVGFWAIGEKPTGSGDPYQLRRAALGVIRIVLENDLRVGLSHILTGAMRPTVIRVIEESKKYEGGVEYLSRAAGAEDIAPWIDTAPKLDAFREATLARLKSDKGPTTAEQSDVKDLLSFLAERLKVYLRDQGARHDLIDAVFSLGGQDDLALIVKRVNALGDFLKTDDGATLLAGVKRAANILSLEEKKDKTSHAGIYDLKLLVAPQELALAAAIEAVKQDTTAAINVENFGGAMRALADLRRPVDAFFEAVIVNDPDPAIRLNRLKLLSEIRQATTEVADFSKIAGA
jgi:glycyl-tRNA synthetase beta chain